MRTARERPAPHQSRRRRRPRGEPGEGEAEERVGEPGEERERHPLAEPPQRVEDDTPAADSPQDRRDDRQRRRQRQDEARVAHVPLDRPEDDQRETGELEDVDLEERPPPGAAEDVDGGGRRSPAGHGEAHQVEHVAQREQLQPAHDAAAHAGADELPNRNPMAAMTPAESPKRCCWAPKAAREVEEPRRPPAPCGRPAFARLGAALLHRRARPHRQATSRAVVLPAGAAVPGLSATDET